MSGQPRALHCPFSAPLHPAAELAHQRALAWADRHGLASCAAVRARMEISRVSRLVGRFWPAADPARLQIAVDWTLLFCLLDDQVEALGALETGARLAGLLAVLDGRAEAGQDALAAALGELRGRMLAVGGAAWTRRFAACVSELFSAFVWESVHRGLGHHPELGAYWVLRERTVGLHPLFLIGELMDTLPAPATLADPRLAAMAATAARVVGWANDIFTCAREREQGEVHNLVLVLAAEQGEGLEAALERAIALHDREVRSFERLEAQLVGHADPAVGRYVRMLRAAMGGHLAWARETGRYKPDTDVTRLAA